MGSSRKADMNIDTAVTYTRLGLNEQEHVDCRLM